MPYTISDFAILNPATGTAGASLIIPQQDALLENGALQNAIFNSANFSSIATDAKGVIQIFNVGAERMLGYAAADVMNKITPADISDPQELIARANALSIELNTLIAPGFEALVFKASRGIEDIYELTYIRKDGSRFPAIVSVTALRDAQNVIIGYLLIGTDNTARKQIEAERMRLDRALHLLSDCNITLVRAKSEADLLNDLCRFIVESGGYEMGWVGVAEHDAAKTIKPVAQSIRAKPYLDCIQISWDSEQDSGRGPTGAAIRTGSTQVNQNCLINPNMVPWRAAAIKQGYHASAAFPLIINNHILGVLTLYSAESDSFGVEELGLLEELASNMAYGMQSMRARSELERYQQQLEERVEGRTQEIAVLNTELLARAADAEAANRAKSAFLSTMSHEIRTPLNAVFGLTQLLADSPLDRCQREYADKLQLSAQALRVLVDDILDFSKIEAGALRLEQVPFSLDAILRTTAAIVSVGLRGKPIEALFDVGQDMPDVLIGDAMRLQQIILNLTSNAVKFTEAGDIVISVQCLAREGGRVTLQFSVRDTGIGIPTGQLGQIFEVFAQADTSITRQYGGTGLGLAISARLADLMGGQIRVDSALGQGSEFRFTVTLAEMPGARPLAPETSVSHLSILIIDDHPLARIILQRSCTAFGWQATAFGSGAAGLDELRCSAAAGRDYDLMLLDWRMPGMDGIEMLRQAYGAPDIGLPQVILMASIFELEQAAAACDGLYLDGIAAKPMTPAILLDAVKRAHAGDFTGILPPADKMERRLEGMRLLVVEDNIINQQVIKQILTRAGAEVVITAGGLDAIEALRPPAACFDALLMDIQMPIMDGYTATRILRDEMGWLDLPIIAVTAYALPEDREKSRRAGMAGHIVKPIDVEDLLDILGRGRRSPSGCPVARPGSVVKATVTAIRIQGVDVTLALKSFRGDEKKYLELLRQFVVNHGGDAGAALDFFRGADFKGAARLIHGLGGMASLLQATQVAGLVTAAARALRESDLEAVPCLLTQLQSAMSSLATAIEQVFN